MHFGLATKNAFANLKDEIIEALNQRIKNIEESFDMRIKKIEAVLFRD